MGMVSWSCLSAVTLTALGRVKSKRTGNSPVMPPVSLPTATRVRLPTREEVPEAPFMVMLLAL